MLPDVSKPTDNIQSINQSSVDNSKANSPKKLSMGISRLNARDLEEIKLVSQGGYAYIFQVKDVNTGEIFALKKMICQSSERLHIAKNEIAMLQSMPSNPHLLKLIDSKIIKVNGGHHAYLLLEFCEGGSLFDFMLKHQEKKIDENQIISVVREICDGIKALHSCQPPITHRDIKIENILLHDNIFKLCDFGSCTSQVVDFGTLPQNEYSSYEEEYERTTTLMYRPPEMCDPYMKYPVNDRVDIWMLGCILYTLCFYKHPFQGTSKLSIINASFSFPKDHIYPEKLIDVIRIMLTPDPRVRPSIVEISNIFENYASLESIQLNSDAQRIKDAAKNHEFDIIKSGSDVGADKSEDISMEELLKIQQKVKQSQKKKNKDDEPTFKNWSDVKYPTLSNNKITAESSNSAWSGFESYGAGFQEDKSNLDKQKQTLNNAFDTFEQFSSDKNATKDTDEQWCNFDFSQTKDPKPEQKSASNENWDLGDWGGPKTNLEGNFTDIQREKVLNSEQTEAKKEDKNSFDFFGKF